MLRKGVYTYECMGGCKKFNEKSLPEEEEELYSNLYLEDIITDSDYMYAKRVCKDSEIKILGEYHDLYLKNGTLLLANVFEDFREMHLKMYHLDPSKLLSAPRLAWQGAFKKTKVKLELIDADKLLKVLEGNIP